MNAPSSKPRDIVIREASPDDVEAIAAIILHGAAKPTLTADEIAVEAVHPGYRAGFDDILASPDTTLFAAERDGVVVGTFQVTILPGLASRGRRRAKFESVHVAPHCRGQGIGAAMIAFALAFAKAKDAELAELSSNKSRLDAHRFYRALGFDQSHEGFKKPV